MYNDIYYNFFEKKICLYGYGERAISLSGKLEKFEKYIDFNAEKIGVENVISPTQFYNMITDNKDNWCIIICMQNALQHSIVANELYNEGFNNIIYIDLSENCNTLYNSKMRDIYLKLLYSNIDYDFEVPTFSAINKKKSLIDMNIIREYDEYIEFWCPLGNVYVDNRKGLALSEARWKEVKVYYDRNITEFKPYIDFYDYLNGDLTNVNCLTLYFEIIGKEPSEEAISDRKKLFQMMRTKMKYDPSYFIDTPSPAKWNKKGYFNLTDGHNRCIFLYKNGYKKLPIIVNGTDYFLYKKWTYRDFDE